MVYSFCGSHLCGHLQKILARAMEEVIAELGMNWKIGIRNGDTYE